MTEEPLYSAEEVLKKYTVEELDLFHTYLGIGKEWKASDRRKELKTIEDAELDRLHDIIEI